MGESYSANAAIRTSNIPPLCGLSTGIWPRTRKRTTTWYWAFNELNEPIFDRDLLAKRLWQRIGHLRESGRLRESRLSETTIRRDIECFVRTYLAKSQSAKGLYEENLESPLSELSLVQPMGVGGGFQFRRGPKADAAERGLPLRAWSQFWRELYPTRREFSVEALCHDPGSPGRVFLLDEESVAERLANMADITEGSIQWDESTGLRQVYAQDVGAIDTLKNIRGLYRSAAACEGRLMSSLSARVRVSRRFQKAVRVDSDFGDVQALEGYVCPPSATQILKHMAAQIADTSQGAFTWTGPYGGGKSSIGACAGFPPQPGSRRRRRSQEADRTQDRRSAPVQDRRRPYRRSRRWSSSRPRGGNPRGR